MCELQQIFLQTWHKDSNIFFSFLYRIILLFRCSSWKTKQYDLAVCPLPYPFIGEQQRVYNRRPFGFTELFWTTWSQWDKDGHNWIFEYTDSEMLELKVNVRHFEHYWKKVFHCIFVLYCYLLLRCIVICVYWN